MTISTVHILSSVLVRIKNTLNTLESRIDDPEILEKVRQIEKLCVDICRYHLSQE